ncbi:MAG: LysR family transcriptional regulator [Candidatus Aeolococcus gillhamiae]|uniref:LysR family transcriptional regulator n=1 Tax=Candidatus Aeolococcus gillhamiae TaxID=3127015 RepID=A0A2W6ADE8_9BACT|nr:MAG: LysR family transcriptional regulator [Candidatus Dormibacter sp. RRmetagenome_bin12]
MTTRLERSLTLRQLRIFTSVVDNRSFTRAARELSLTQPAVTHQMQALARAVGYPLLDPARRAPELTAIGRALYERAARILASVGDAEHAIGDLAGLRAGTVRVAGDTTVGVYVLPDALAAFHHRHPKVELSLDVVNRSRVHELLVDGSADLGVVGRLWDDGLLEAEPFLDNQLMCFSAPTHPLVEREPLQPRDLLDGPLLLRERGSGTRESAELILAHAGVQAVSTMDMASNGALKRAVAGGLGVTVLSTHAVQLEVQLGLLRPLRVEGFPVQRRWHVMWVRDRSLSAAAEAFRAFLQASEWRSALSVQLGTD